MRRTLTDRAAWIIAGVLALALLASLAGVVRGGPLDPVSPPAPTQPQAEPRSPISSLPATISQPGSYFVTKNLTGVSGQFGISVTTDNVTIDLNGFSLVGTAGSLDAIELGPGLKNVVVRNGTITSWPGIAINAQSAEGGRYEDLTIVANSGGGIVAGPASIVRNCVVKANGGNGIAINQPLTSDASVVEHCVAEGSVLDGIQISNNVTVRDNNVVENNIGIHAINDGSTIDGNTIKTGTDKALKVDGINNLIVRNFIRGVFSDVQIANLNTKGPFENQGSSITNPWSNLFY